MIIIAWGNQTLIGWQIWLEIFRQKVLEFLEGKRESQEGKLCFYSKMKNGFRKEEYLQIDNTKIRNAIRDIRMSTHKLEIETGRHSKIEREQRLCVCCEKKEIETEEHLLLHCTNYEDNRKKLRERLGEKGEIS